MIRFILVAILVLILIRMIGQSFLSFYQGMYGNTSARDQNRKNEKEGDVTIETQKKSVKKISRSDGEYVDYEEIK